MGSHVFVTGVAATVPEITREWVIRARHQFATENIQAGASHGVPNKK
jgi:hypothetical protein